MISGILGYDKVANALMALHPITDTSYKHGQLPHEALLVLL